MQFSSILRRTSRLSNVRYVTQAISETSRAAGVVQTKEEQPSSRLKMKGWQIHSYGGVEELQFSDKLKMPQIRKSDECLVKVLSTTVNPIDVAMLSGYGATVLNVMRGSTSTSIEFPLTLGREFCGVLVQKGMGVSDFKLPLGQRVWGVVPVQSPQGSHGEYVTVPQYCVSFLYRANSYLD